MIYIATTWTNPHLEGIKQAIAPRPYYHFTESGLALNYSEIVPGLRNTLPHIQAKQLRHPSIMKSMQCNAYNIKQCTHFLLAEPASKGSYTEFGMAAALNKHTILLVTDGYELGVMDALFDTICYSLEELRRFCQ